MRTIFIISPRLNKLSGPYSDHMQDETLSTQRKAYVPGKCLTCYAKCPLVHTDGHGRRWYRPDHVDAAKT